MSHPQILGHGPESADASFRAPLDRGLDRIESRGLPVLRKLFGAGEAHARDREAQALERAAGPSVPRVVEIGEDPESRRPYLDIEWVGDEDLRMRVGRVGPLPFGEVLAIAQRAASTLARVHALGLCHGDLKPANFVLGEGGATLVDFENAVEASRQDQLSESFTGGTYGYAPPEAYLGHAVDRGFDAYGLGAVLHFALTGQAPMRHSSGEFDAATLLRLRPTLPFEFLQVISRLLALQAAMRPSADELVAALASIEIPESEVELALLRGDAAPPSASNDEAALCAVRQHWRARLDRVLEAIPRTPSDRAFAERLEGAIRFCRAIWLCLDFLPLQAMLRDRLERAQERLPKLLAEIPGEVQRCRQQMELAEGRHLARRGLDLCRFLSVLNLPERLVPQEIERIGFGLQSAIRLLDHGERQRQRILARLDEAEAALDFDVANAALEELREEFSGASRSTARIRDRHQRLVWLLRRLLAGEESVARSCELLSKPLPALQAAFTRIRVRIGDDAKNAADGNGNGNRGDAREPLTLSQLARVFGEIHEDWPRIDFGEAIIELRGLRHDLTLHTQELANRISERLQLDPVPIRPLRKDVTEVDRVLLLDGLSDVPGLPRSRLIDRLEQLRLRVESVSDQHRRIAAGAREQMEQGRLTTALYDLERALRANSEGDAEQSEELSRELERAKRLRDEVGRATRRNLELAELYAQLQDDDDATLDAKLRCLDQRADTLQFLLDNGPTNFRSRYETDLDRLRADRIVVEADDAEREYHANEPGAARVAIAESVLGRIADLTRDSETSRPSGRLGTLAQRWEEYRERASGELEAARSSEAASHAASKRRRFLGIAAGVLLAASGLFWIPGLVSAGASLESRLAKASDAQAVQALATEAKGQQRQLLNALATALAAPAEDREAALDALATRASSDSAFDKALRETIERLRKP